MLGPNSLLLQKHIIVIMSAYWFVLCAFHAASNSSVASKVHNYNDMGENITRCAHNYSYAHMITNYAQCAHNCNHD